MNIGNSKIGAMFLLIPVLFAACTDVEQSEVRISCANFANYSQLLSDETSDYFNGPEIREFGQNFIDFCENNEITEIDDCKNLEVEVLCKNTVGVRANSIDLCNGDSGCEVVFAAVHVDDCNSYGKAGLKNSCLFTKSYIENDRKYCDQILELTVDSYVGNFSEEDFYSYYLNRSKCLWGFADRNDDADLCDEIPGSTEADLCNFSMAVKLSDLSFCKKLKSLYFTEQNCVEVVNSNGDHPAFANGILNYNFGATGSEAKSEG